MNFSLSNFQNKNFVRECYLISKYLKCSKYRLKIENTVLTLNQTSHLVSFNFRHFMNFSLYLFVFVSFNRSISKFKLLTNLSFFLIKWFMESLNISVLFYVTVRA